MAASAYDQATSGATGLALLALRAALEARVALGQAPGQRLVVAGLEVQAGHVLDAAPVAAPGGAGRGVDGDQRGRDRHPFATRDEHHPVLRHRAGHAREEVAREVGRALVCFVGEGVAMVEESSF